MKEIVRKVKINLKPKDVDKTTIRRDHYFPNAYIIDIPLDSMPDHVWQNIFEREWKSSRHLWDRKIFVVGDKLRLVTTVNDIEGKLDWVKQVVEQTNKDIDKYNREIRAFVSQTEEKLKRQVLEEEVRIEMIRDIMRKKFA